MKTKDYDLIIIGGGIMGLMTAYFASQSIDNIVILEKRTIGNKQAASFSFTRSLRTDYLDPFYARLANEARSLWLELQVATSEPLLAECGCLNLVKKSVTPEVAATYGARSYQVIKALKFGPQALNKAELQIRFPQFAVDQAYLDSKGGYFDLQAIAAFLLVQLADRGVTIIESVAATTIRETATGVSIGTNQGNFIAEQLVITAGQWTNEVIQQVQGNSLQLPISLDRPKQCKYFYPEDPTPFLPENFPVFAYLDVGIYGHPIFDRQKGAVKISYYNPPDLAAQSNSQITSINDFVGQCLPALRGARSEDVTDADQCFYDLVADDNFIVGALPGYERIAIGTGWRGTGYKFAPLIGKIMSQLALQRGTVYDISSFSPERFSK
jgi:glycine/D-amino acid oxidase-like deaminating enzyme